MQITLEALELAFAPIEELSHGESTFPVGDTNVTLRILLPEEEAEVQTYASQKMEESSPLEYIERFKKAVLSYSLVEIGELDLRGVSSVETGEKLDNGKLIKIPKIDAVRQMVGKWTGSVRTGVFHKYVDLVTRVEDRARQAIVFEPTDRDSEINRLTKDIEKLQDRLKTLTDERDNAGVDLSTQLAKTAREIERIEQKVRPTETEAAEPDPENPPEQILPVAKRSVPGPRQPITPQQAAPPTPTAKPEAPAEEPVPVRVAPEPLADVEDSFVDPGDQEGMAAAIAAENRRVLARRQHAGRDLPPAPASVINAALAIQPRRPPHLDALEAENELETASTARGAVYAGKTADGVDTFRMPTEDLVERRGTGENQQRVPLNRGQNPKVSQNPRFKPAPKM